MTATGGETGGWARPKGQLRQAGASQITRSDILRLHLKNKATPYQSNRTVAVAASMFNWAGKRGLVPEGFNPARGVERFKEEGRERFLSVDELQRLGAALLEAEVLGIPWEFDAAKPISKHVPKENRRTVIGEHAAAAIRLLLFTGCRLQEILHLRWSEIDFDRGLLFLPKSKTGKKTIVLNAPALAVLHDLERIGEFVIASGSLTKPRHDLKRPWEAVTHRAGLEGLRIHDLRHTYASFGAGSGLGLPIVGKLLGHASTVTTARYAHLDADPLRVASDRIGSTIAAALAGRQRGPVVPLKLVRGP